MSERRCLFAFTETRPGVDYQAYVSLNMVDPTSPAPFELTVRSTGEQQGHVIRLGRYDLNLLMQAIYTSVLGLRGPLP